MTRDQNASIEDVFRPALLLELNLDTGDANVWTGSGTLPWGGKDWLGLGELGTFSAVKEGTKFQDDRITATMSGIAAEGMRDLIAEFNEDSPVGRPWSLYLAIFSEEAKLQSVDLLSAGFVDAVNYSTGSVEITLATEAVLFGHIRFYRKSDAMQQKLFSGDKGLEFVTDLNDAINWGSAPPTIIGEDLGEDIVGLRGLPL